MFPIVLVDPLFFMLSTCSGTIWFVVFIIFLIARSHISPSAKTNFYIIMGILIAVTILSFLCSMMPLWAMMFGSRKGMTPLWP